MSSNAGLDLITDDDRAKPCKVELHRKSLIGPFAYHWVFYFRWEGGYDMYCEGVDDDKVLRPHCERGMPEMGLFPLVEDLGTRQDLSPKRVNTLALRNRCNGKVYEITRMNCQVWAKQLAGDLGIDILTPINVVGSIPGSEVIDELHSIVKYGSGSSSLSKK
ncbi:uncharacterized protein [Macrobrachium rosenbergii]|uniref:uncharacterized protein isoform X4 n=1 Tax=Macrobrachium rosenbergii TaxID=79674 RepID=UPI0034D444E8